MYCSIHVVEMCQTSGADRIHSLQQEISGFERLCQAKDKLLVAKEVEQLQLEETIRQRLLEELQTLEKVGVCMSYNK